jgi:hypothetical protein
LFQEVLIILIGTVILIGLGITISIINKKTRRRKAVFHHEVHASWNNAQKVSELIALYVGILLRHGPDSHEANAFRFGVDNSELWKGNESMQIYGELTEIIDSVFRDYKKEKK